MANTPDAPTTASQYLDINRERENATFNVSGKELVFNNIRDFLMGEFKKNDGFVHPDTYEFLVPFWTNILGYVQNLSNSNDILVDYFKQQEEKALKKIFILFSSKEIAQKYDFDHRKYIVDRMSNDLECIAINEDIADSDDDEAQAPIELIQE